MSYLLISSSISVPPTISLCAAPPYSLKPDSGRPPSICIVRQDGDYDNDDDKDEDLEGEYVKYRFEFDPELDLDLNLESDSDSN